VTQLDSRTSKLLSQIARIRRRGRRLARASRRLLLLIPERLRRMGPDERGNAAGKVRCLRMLRCGRRSSAGSAICSVSEARMRPRMKDTDLREGACFVAPHSSPSRCRPTRPSPRLVRPYAPVRSQQHRHRGYESFTRLNGWPASFLTDASVPPSRTRPRTAWG
jgi:hypothetical protein